MRIRRLWAPVVLSTLLALILAACDGPADPDSATNRIQATHVLRAGASEHRPWIWFEGNEAHGPEAELLKGFAAGLGAQVAWSRGPETPLVKALEDRKLDVVAGGFLSDTVWGSQVGVSQAYSRRGLLRPGHVILTATGENQLLLRLDRFLMEHGRPGNG